MGKIKGIVLDATLLALARDLIKLEETTGVAPDIDKTVSNWNAKHKMAENTSQLQNDVALFINVEKNRQLKSMNVGGYAAYKAEPYVEKAKKLMSAPNLGSKPETE
ncbi:hypothetical protein [Proteus terrae]|uniref:hypothetical protein n=1 Tax=Proteus terrae TaxID=1574161 RepID=UPI0024AA72B1|nr:hypothetical protein [Proteus terrae]EJD6044299.1 hypothetical protein [Providencia rettgeri]ELR5126930.1 hypothetical protein [Providencia rettgeri]ELR5246029.1 hypothetical protein [Providencia rettgeri]ELS4585121.1 hypothetical protein [Providencia rettgeri]